MHDIIPLTSVEKDILNKRGFYVKRLPISERSIIIDTIILFLVLFFGSIFNLLIISLFHIDVFIIFVWLLAILTTKGIYNYILNNRVYFLKKQILWQGYVEDNKNVVIDYGYILSDTLCRYIFTKKNLTQMRGIIGLMLEIHGNKKQVIILMLIFAIPLLVSLFFIFPNVVIPATFTLIVPIFLRQFNSVFRFGKYATTLQDLTNILPLQVIGIKNNFEGNINFAILNKSFKKFSQILSNISSQLTQLEKLESYMKHGDLFDSTKYIHSMRKDIAEPLQSLRSFLESQREKLHESQKELQKVRVRGMNEADPSLRSGGQEHVSGGQEHTELASKRGESLIAELDKNIGRLDMMITKMG